MSEGTPRSSTESSSAASSGELDLELTLGGNTGSTPDSDHRKRPSTSDPDRSPPATSDAPPKPKKPLVGWPPVPARWGARRAKFVKVGVDGAPYKRKVDLEAYAGYKQLLAALQGMFASHFTVRKAGNDEMKLVDAVSGTEYVPTYEDKEGDLMLVGDVPWRMFVDACQHLRLMKSSEAVNLSPRASR